MSHARPFCLLLLSAHLPRREKKPPLTRFPELRMPRKWALFPRFYTGSYSSIHPRHNCVLSIMIDRCSAPILRRKDASNGSYRHAMIYVLTSWLITKEELFARAENCAFCREQRFCLYILLHSWLFTFGEVIFSSADFVNRNVNNAVVM